MVRRYQRKLAKTVPEHLKVCHIRLINFVFNYVYNNQTCTMAALKRALEEKRILAFFIIFFVNNTVSKYVSVGMYVFMSMYKCILHYPYQTVMHTSCHVIKGCLLMTYHVV